MPKRGRALALLAASATALVLAGGARADGPRGGTIVQGSAEITRAEGRTTIRQSSRRAIIDWRRFDVGRDHRVEFDQPGRDAATLNRVVTARPSVIEGAIRAPGTVLIQNGAGVIFTGTRPDRHRRPRGHQPARRRRAVPSATAASSSAAANAPARGW